MPIPSETLALLRKTPHKSKLYLSVLKPRLALSAQVNGSLARGATAIPYDNGAGDTSLVQAGQSLIVTTQWGNQAVRVQSISGTATSGTITVAANSIVWPDNGTLALYEDSLDYPLISRFTAAGDFYKDWDVPYADEGEKPAPVCIAGGHRAGWLYAGQVEFTFDLSGSYAIADGATIASYGLSVVPSNGAQVIDDGGGVYRVIITQAGQWWVEANCTDSIGTTQKTRRRIVAHDTTQPPYSELTINSLAGSFERGGWSLDIGVYGKADVNEFPPNTLVVLWREQWIEGQRRVVGDDVLFAGYIVRDSIERNWQTGAVDFEAVTIDRLLANHFMYAVSLSAVRSPSNWYEYSLWLTPGRAIHHLWRYHSTLLEMCDVLGLTESTTRRKYADMPQATLLSMAQTMAQSAQARIVCDRQGRLHMVRDLQLRDDAGRNAAPTLVDLLASDYSGDTTLTAQEPRAALVNVEGLFFDGAEIKAFCAKAPGETFENRGAAPIDVTQQVLASQAHANSLAGRVLARENNPYPAVQLEFEGGWAGVLDVTLQEWVLFDLPAADNPRGFAWVDRRLLCRDLQLRYEADSGTLTASVSFEVEALGPDGIGVDCITALPTAPARKAPKWNAPDTQRLRALMTFGSMGSHYRDDNAADWTARNGGLTGGNEIGQDGARDPFTLARQGSNPESAIVLRVGGGKVWKSTSAGGAWVEITPTVAPPNTFSDTPAPLATDLNYTCVESSIILAGHHYVLADWQNGASAWRGWLAVTTNDGTSWTWYDVLAAGEPAPAALRPLWLSADKSDGSVLWATRWTAGDKLNYVKFSLLDYSGVLGDLGAATQAEMEASVYGAAPLAPLGDAQLCLIYGRMGAPAGLTGDQHIIQTVNGGTGWTSVESSWGADECAALWVGPDVGGNRQWYAVRQG